MKSSEKVFKATSAVSGILAIASAFLLIVLIALAIIGYINPRQIKLVIKTESISKEYDGSPVTGDIEITYGDLISGHTLEVITQSELDEIGTIDNKAEIKIIDSTGADVTSAYDIQFDYGTLTMLKRKIKLSIEGASKTYDGTPLTSTKINDSNSRLADGDSIKTISTSELTEVGKIENKPIFIIVNKKGEDVTNNYEIIQSYGELKVNPILLTIKTEDKKKLYDGKALICENFSITQGELLNGHSISVKKSASIITVGKTENSLEFSIYDSKGNDVSRFYSITQKKGVLEVTGKTIVISTGSATKEYDGNPLTNNEWAIKTGSLNSGHKIRLVESISFNKVGSTDNILRVMVVDEDNNDVTNQYSISYAYGTLSVTPAKLTLLTDSIQEQYTGKPISCNTYRITSGTLCDNHNLSLVCKSWTSKGTYANNVVSYKITEVLKDGSTRDVTDCYQIVFEAGRINIY